MAVGPVWEQDVGSSSLPSRTTAPEIERFQGLFSYSLSITAQDLRTVARSRQLIVIFTKLYYN